MTALVRSDDRAGWEPFAVPVPTSSRTFCNPLDLEYRYQDVRFSGMVDGVQLGASRRSVHREAADPSIVRYRDRYFLFASMSLTVPALNEGQDAWFAVDSFNENGVTRGTPVRATTPRIRSVN